MHKIYEAANLIDAELVAQMLRMHGIQVVTEGWYRQGALGELPVNATPTLWVADAEVERARSLLEQHWQWCAAQAAQKDWVCVHCGESVPASMASCWACGEAREG